ncbi:MAG: FAD binding domain-containing protein, partial [Christensenellales bacterium]
MIPFDFIYLRPDTLAQAIALHGELSRTGKSPVYYAGGSEIITMSRVCAIRPGAVIDIKGLPDLQTLAQNEGGLTLGAGLTLASIAESKRFALMKLACGRIADHTNQCRITLGGNLCGTIRYRETSLPLLLCDAAVTLAGADGARTLPFEQAFDGRVLRAPDEVLTQVHVPAWALGARHAHIKKTAQEKIDYPLVNLTAIWKGDELR